MNSTVKITSLVVAILDQRRTFLDLHAEFYFIHHVLQISRYFDDEEEDLTRTLTNILQRPSHGQQSSDEVSNYDINNKLAGILYTIFSILYHPLGFYEIFDIYTSLSISNSLCLSIPIGLKDKNQCQLI
jgi:hypothetical protein